MDKQTSVQSFIASVRDLCAVLSQEIAHVRAMRLGAIRELQEPKARLALAYADGCARLTGDPASLAGLAPELKDALRQATAELKKLIAGNARALDAARQVNERMLRAVAEAVTEIGDRPRLYAANGSRAARRGELCGGAVPLALDRQA